MNQSEETVDRLLWEVGEDLAASPIWLTFRPGVERRYRSTTDAARNPHYFGVGIFGLIVFDLFLVVDWQMMPDIFPLAMVVHLGFMTPVGLANLAFMRYFPAFGQASLFVTLLLVMACSTLLYSQSQMAGALLLPFAFPSVLITGTILMPLRFNLALPFAILSGVMITAAILGHSGYEEGAKAFTLLTVLSACAYTVFAGYRMEASDRRAFLLSLRESLRAEVLVNDNHHLRELVGTDALTGIGNRRLFDTMLDRLWREGLLSGEPLGLLLLDVDHFKALNDRYGHLVGDSCLVVIGTILREHTRESRDCAARYGGEEFAVLLPNATMARVQDVAERLRNAVQAQPVALDGPACAGVLHVSIGCASSNPCLEASSSSLVAAADTALYSAKRRGRNRIHPPLGGGTVIAIRTAARA